LARVIDIAARLYHTELSRAVSMGARGALEYLRERRVFAKAVDVFRLGYAPKTAGQPWIASRIQVPEKTLFEAGLLVFGKGGALVDPMAGRLVFPQTTAGGDVVGFLGRAIDPEVPEGYKYVATPQTALFRRSEVLYRIDLAFRTIASGNLALVVEGPLDAVLLWQIGQHNVVATGSKRMTDAQAQILARYTQRLEVMFDRGEDEAFDKLRSSRGMFFSSVEKRPVPPPHKDPADWIRSVIDQRLAG
jgi:DNA primase